jgi:phosphoenolpyruvate---glycerone phosphotransferase subunit DhaK
VGVGIHGEPGRRRETLGTAGEIAALMVDAVTSDLAPSEGARVLTFVNGLGGTPQIELYLLYGEVERRLHEAGLEPARNLVGGYITSLEMAGASLTLLELDEELIALWDAPVHTPALRWGV